MPGQEGKLFFSTCEVIAGCIDLPQGWQLRGPSSREGAGVVAVVHVQDSQLLQAGVVEAPGPWQCPAELGVE